MEAMPITPISVAMLMRVCNWAEVSFGCLGVMRRRNLGIRIMIS